MEGEGGDTKKKKGKKEELIDKIFSKKTTNFMQDKIITGSFQGKLRIYYPKQMKYSIENLLLEEQLEQPILQIAAGKFSS